MSRFILLALSLLLASCSDNNNYNGTPVGPAPEPFVQPDFSMADAWLEDFVATENAFPGASIAIVDKENAVIHRAFFGNQTEDRGVLLASTSKVPAVMLMLALDDDDANVTFDMDQPIGDYLPWPGVWDSDITSRHLVSNRSGIPGLANLFTRPLEYAPHLCQYVAEGTLLECAETLFTTPLTTIAATPANSAFDYGGSQWQLAGGVAETVGGASWNQLWDQYIGAPCELELFRWGNNLGIAEAWDGNPDSLVGLANPNMEGGAMTNVDTYAKLISLHLNDGWCGENRVLSAAAVAAMRQETTPAELGAWGYGMGWWTIISEEGRPITLFVDPGFYGSISWIDTERNYGGVVLLEDYTGAEGSVGSGGVIDQLIPLIEQAIDMAR
jgi:CubicO group peptidase (beta-lactamase class C family)